MIIQNGTIRKLGCGFLFDFHSNYGSILYYFLNKPRYWPKIVIFFIPPCIRRPVGDPRRIIAIPFGMQKLEWRGYSTSTV